MNTRISGDVGIKVQLTVTDCASCGMVFAITQDFEKRRREDGKGFYYPNGHSLSYGNSEIDKLRKKLGQVEENAVWWRARACDYEEDAQREKRQKAAVKGQLTKFKKRVANGVCPCCNRTFANLSRHMANQHPDFAGEVIE